MVDLYVYIYDICTHSRTLLFIHSLYNTSHLLTPNSQHIPPPSFTPWQPQVNCPKYTLDHEVHCWKSFSDSPLPSDKQNPHRLSRSFRTGPLPLSLSLISCLSSPKDRLPKVSERCYFPQGHHPKCSLSWKTLPFSHSPYPPIPHSSMQSADRSQEFQPQRLLPP